MLGNLLISVKLMKFVLLSLLNLLYLSLIWLITISIVNCDNYHEYFTLLRYAFVVVINSLFIEVISIVL